MGRQQLPPQIRKLDVADRKTGKTIVRYQLTVDAGSDPDHRPTSAGAPPLQDRAQARDELGRITEQARPTRSFRVRR